MNNSKSEVGEAKHKFQLKSGSSPQCGYHIKGLGSCHRLADDEIHSAVVQEADRCPECNHTGPRTDSGLCLEYVPKDNDDNTCGHRCVFPSTSVDKTSVRAGKDLATQPTESPHSAPERMWVATSSLLRGYGYTYLSDDDAGDLVEYLRADLVRAARWMASVVYIHYHNRTDLDPVQQKHLELAMKAGAPFSEKTEAAAATYAANQRNSGQRG